MELKTVDGTGPGWRLSVADSFFARFMGLMGRKSLDAGEGLFLPGTNSIHMLFMRFPIDCLFVGALRADGSREVVGVRERLAPWRGVVWWVRGARGAIEVPAGSLAAAGLRRGDYVTLEPTR
jgi:uncharacterized membrane protein (UPF0127 family)